jgi:PhnO protein
LSPQQRRGCGEVKSRLAGVGSSHYLRQLRLRSELSAKYQGHLFSEIFIQFMETKIRKATLDDYHIIFDFIHDLENKSFDPQKFLAIFKQNLQNHNILYFLATIDNNPVGFISAHIQLLLHHSEKVAEVQEFYVAPEFRRMGVGNTLLKHILNILKLDGINQIEVCSNKMRIDAHKFYSANGFMESHYKYTMKM